LRAAGTKRERAPGEAEREYELERVARRYEPMPAQPKAFDEILHKLKDDVLAFTRRLDHGAWVRWRPSRMVTPPGRAGAFRPPNVTVVI
jgi:hypothetical protein